MQKLLVLAHAATAVAEDFTGSPFRWPDMLRNGGRVVQILSNGKNPRPEQWNYPKWYGKYPMRFVEDVPVPPGGEVAGGELVILEYDITDKMELGTFQNVMDEFSPKHNELGLIAKDQTGKELGRYVFSLWPIGNDEIDDLNKDLRQRPRFVNESLVTKNRAVTSIELSKANTWWGLPKNTKQIHVSNLNRQGYHRALQAVKDYAENHQYFNDYEITMPDGKVAMPAVTSNSFIEQVVQVATNQKAFDDGLGKMGYLAVSVDKKKAKKFNFVETQRVKDLMENTKVFSDHYNKDVYIVPAYYDPQGNPRPEAAKEKPDEWYVIWSSGVAWRQNYRKAEEFRQTNSIKVGAAPGLNLRHVDPEFEQHEVKQAANRNGKGKRKNKKFKLGKKNVV